MLTIDSNGRKPCGLRKSARSTTALDIGEGFTLFNSAHPLANCLWMGFCENGNGPVVNAPHAQDGNGGTLLNPFFYQWTFQDKWQLGFHVDEQLLEFFFTETKSCGKDRLIFFNPIWAR